MAEVRGIKVEMTTSQVAYRGTTRKATLDFAPEEIPGDGWGSAPTEETVREVFRLLVHAGAVDEPENWAQPRIVSCEPDPESPVTHYRTKGNADGSSERVLAQASRWTVVSHTPYSG